jgi:hypothetical protein
VRLLDRLNLLAAIAIAAFGVYAWQLTTTRRVLVFSRSHDLPAPHGSVSVSGTQVWMVDTRHPHAVWAYLAWITAAAVCLMTIRALHARRAQPRSV